MLKARALENLRMEAVERYGVIQAVGHWGGEHVRVIRVLRALLHQQLDGFLQMLLRP